MSPRTKRACSRQFGTGSRCTPAQYFFISGM